MDLLPSMVKNIRSGAPQTCLRSLNVRHGFQDFKLFRINKTADGKASAKAGPGSGAPAQEQGMVVRQEARPVPDCVSPSPSFTLALLTDDYPFHGSG
jgi:hypothetical protein